MLQGICTYFAPVVSFIVTHKNANTQPENKSLTQNKLLYTHLSQQFSHSLMQLKNNLVECLKRLRLDIKVQFVFTESFNQLNVIRYLSIIVPAGNTDRSSVVATWLRSSTFHSSKYFWLDIKITIELFQTNWTSVMYLTRIPQNSVSLVQSITYYTVVNHHSQLIRMCIYLKMLLAFPGAV